MNKTIFTILLIVFTAWNADAKIWRVNNTPGVAADFKDLQDGIDAASAGDTIYLEGSKKSYSSVTLNKRLTIIGPGYFLGGANGNAGLQADIAAATVGLSLDSLASGSVIMGITFQNLSLGSGQANATDNITISRCNITQLTSSYPNDPHIAENWEVTKCYIGTMNVVGKTRNWNVSNNIITGLARMSNPANFGNVIRNNVFGGTIDFYEGYFANNILKGTVVTLTNLVVKHNIAIGNPAAFAPYVGTDGNKAGFTEAQVFQDAAGNSTDGQWRLATGSPAIGAGVTIGAVISPDAGAFGGPDPYRLSGIPPIPTIYSITVPASVPAGSATMTVTLSTRSNN